MSRPFQGPLDHPYNSEDNHAARKNATDVTRENRPLRRIQETVYINSLSRMCDIRYSQITPYDQPSCQGICEGGFWGLPRKMVMKIKCDQGWFPTAEKNISNKANAEFKACLLILLHLDRVVARVPLPANSDQNTIVTRIGNVMIVVNSTVWASWNGRYHLLRGDVPVRVYQSVWHAANRK